jgi:hypothetical protein
MYAGANMGHPSRLIQPCGWVQRLLMESCGIPHLAKNERDVGHPIIVAGTFDSATAKPLEGLRVSFSVQECGPF